MELCKGETEDLHIKRVVFECRTEVFEYRTEFIIVVLDPRRPIVCGGAIYRDWALKIIDRQVPRI